MPLTYQASLRLNIFLDKQARRLPEEATLLPVLVKCSSKEKMMSLCKRIENL